MDTGHNEFGPYFSTEYLLEDLKRQYGKLSIKFSKLDEDNLTTDQLREFIESCDSLQEQALIFLATEDLDDKVTDMQIFTKIHKLCTVKIEELKEKMGYQETELESSESSNEDSNKDVLETEILDDDTIEDLLESIVDDPSENTEEGIRIHHTLKHLVLEYCKSDKKPLNYYNFIVDPTCFGTTVENMYYVSVLIFEGKARIIVEDRVPYISPKKPKKAGEKDEKKNQAVLSINMYKWDKIIKDFNITECLIPRLPGTASSSSYTS